MNRSRVMLGFDRADAGLLWNFVKMNTRDKYLGSTLGSAWAVVNPLLLLLVFTFVFGFVYKARLPGANTTLSYAIWLISGYGPWIATTEAITATTMSLVSAAGLIKNMPIKAEILPVSAALSGVLPLGVCSFFLAILLVLDGNALSWHAMFVVVIAVLQFAFVAALGVFLSPLTVFVRDFGIVLPNVLTILLFATPIFYPIDAMPRMLRIISYANPFYIISDGYRQALLYHRTPGLVGLTYLALLTVVLGTTGLRLFRRVRTYLEARL